MRLFFYLGIVMLYSFFKIRRSNVFGILYFLALMTSSCGNNGSDNKEHLSIQTKDSIQLWIDEGRDNETNNKKREESLEKAHEAAIGERNDSIRTKYFSKISLGYLNLNDSSKFRNTNIKTIYLASKIGDTIALAEAHWDLAYFFSRMAVRDSAYYFFSLAHEEFSDSGDNFLAARMLYNMAVEQGRAKDYTGSEINTIRAIELLTPLKKYKELYNSYNNLGSITKELGEYDSSIEYYKKALAYAEKLDNSNTISNLLQNNIGNVYKERGLFSEAISYYKKVLVDNNLKLIYPGDYASALDNMAYSEFKLGNSSKALNKFREALKIRDSIKDLTGISRSNFNLAEYYLARGDTATALEYALRAKRFAELSSNNQRLLETLALITKLDPRHATSYTQEYIALNDSLQRAERHIRNKFARIRFETDEVVAQNELLARQRQLWIGIAAGLLLLALATFIIIDQRAKNQKLRFQQQQQEANNEIFNLMLSQKQKVEEGKQSEQKRISEELHDGVLGEMNGARMVLLGLNNKSDTDAVAMRSQAIAKLQEVQEEIRTISHELNDAAYQKFHNFIISIQELLQSVGATASLQHNFAYDKDTDWDNLTADIKINLYRIVQECLMNCLKHAQAQNVSLEFNATGKELLISIRDDGKGFDTKKGKKGIGHKNIKSRVEKLDGSWEVSSAPGKGTKVNIHIPYYKPKSEAGVKSITSGMLHKV